MRAMRYGSLSAMKHRAFILVPFLVLFSLISGLISNIAVNEFRVRNELENAQVVDAFSLVEIETFKRIKAQFKTFKPVDFSYEAGAWSIVVNFQEETAHIVYDGQETIQAVLKYDMVMENILDYTITADDSNDSD